MATFLSNLHSLRGIRHWRLLVDLQYVVALARNHSDLYDCVLASNGLMLVDSLQRYLCNQDTIQGDEKGLIADRNFRHPDDNPPRACDRVHVCANARMASLSLDQTGVRHDHVARVHQASQHPVHLTRSTNHQESRLPSSAGTLGFAQLSIRK